MMRDDREIDSRRIGASRQSEPKIELPQENLDQLEMYKLILDSVYNGVVVTDAYGYVTHFNKPYGQFLGVDPEAQIGKHVTEVIENTRMHIVAETGQPEICWSHRIKGQNMVVQRIPMKKDGKVIAVFGQVMFKDVSDLSKLAKKLSLLESKVEFYEQELISLRSTRYTIDSIVGVSDQMVNLKREALKAARTRLPVLITGRSGTGKELFAQAIHCASGRRLYPFIRINCAAIPKDLLESELFGYERGAFTGARSDGKPGKFELAHHGTVFLDEIGDLPLEMQPKLLRVLEEKEFERIGATSLLRADFRLIAASNQNLEEMVGQGRFRQDLLYRLNVIPLHIPPLRERREDIIPLSSHILREIVADAGLRGIKIDPRAEEVLRNYEWPGNVRELSNVLERVSCSLEKDTIYPRDLPFYLHSKPANSAEPSRASLKDVKSASEKEAIRHALAATNNNKARAADLLGIHRTLLYKKMKKYGLPLD
ncbi:MAG: sigma 54-interacting transcriptional regulator [Desulfomonilaceae bacterium]